MVTTRHQALLAKAEGQEEEEEEEATDHDDHMVDDQMEDPGGLPEPGSAADFVTIGADIMNRSPPSIFSGGHSRAFNERWAAHFQVEPEVCENVWTRLDTTEFDGSDEEGQPCHLLWLLVFLKTYATWPVISSMCGGIDEDTVSKWVWIFVCKISYLEFDVVCLSL